MQFYCIACNKRYFYREGDEDCSKFICPDCFNIKMGSGKWERLRFKIFNRDEFTCKYCGNSPLKDNNCTLCVDHIIPKSEVICNSELNLITSCNVCNWGKLDYALKKESKQKVDEYLKNNKTKERLENVRNTRIEKKRNVEMEDSKVM